MVPSRLGLLTRVTTGTLPRFIYPPCPSSSSSSHTTRRYCLVGSFILFSNMGEEGERGGMGLKSTDIGDISLYHCMQPILDKSIRPLMGETNFTLGSSQKFLFWSFGTGPFFPLKSSAFRAILTAIYYYILYLGLIYLNLDSENDSDRFLKQIQKIKQ